MTSTPARQVAPRILRPAQPAGPSSSRGVRPEAVLALIGAGVVAVVGLWWNDTDSLSGLGDWLTNAGRVTGLLAGYGLVVLIALMARLPPLERGVGADRLARWHSMGGRYTVSLVIAHGTLIIWGYAVSAHTDVVHQTKTLLSTYPDVLMGTVAGLLLIMIGIVSARAARRRMRYETWYHLHLYTYLATALAFSHQFSTGADFVDNRPARVAWSSLYAVVGALIVWYRFAVPVVQAFRHRLHVESVRHEADGVVSVVVAGRRLDELDAQPGQFFRWRFLNRQLWWSANPYSLSAAPGSNRMRFTAKDFGAQSAALAQLRPGTRVAVEGPYGAMTAARRTRRKVLLIAGGIGVTPLRTLLETLPAAPGDLTMLYRCGAAEQVVLANELNHVASVRGARLHYLIGHRSELATDPLSAASLTANIPDLRDHDIYVCGPAGMTDPLIRALRRAGVPRRHIHHESFDF